MLHLPEAPGQAQLRHRAQRGAARIHLEATPRIASELPRFNSPTLPTGVFRLLHQHLPPAGTPDLPMRLRDICLLALGTRLGARFNTLTKLRLSALTVRADGSLQVLLPSAKNTNCVITYIIERTHRPWTVPRLFHMYLHQRAQPVASHPQAPVFPSDTYLRKERTGIITPAAAAAAPNASRNTVTKWIRAAITRVGLTDDGTTNITPKTFRRTFATVLADSDVPPHRVDIVGRFGVPRSGPTRDVYIHPVGSHTWGISDALGL